MADTVFIVTKAIIRDDKVVCALVHDSLKSVMIIRPHIINENPPRCALTWSEPDGAERLDWLEKLGMITEEEFVQESKKLKGVQRKELYESLKKEMERGV